MNSAPLYTLEAASFAYRRQAALSEITLQLLPGRLYGLIGPNGSGKTTLLDLLTATKTAHQGRVALLGRPVAGYGKRELARLLALVPQEFALPFDYRVAELVLMGRHPHIPRFAAPSAHDLAVVAQAMAALDIEHLAERPVSRLSGGEKQRVVVARALAQETPILILDEATANLDIHHTVEILGGIRKRVREQDACVVAAIHDLGLAAAFCDELIVLKEGRLHALGPVREILSAALIREVFAVEAQVAMDPAAPPQIHYSFFRQEQS